MIKKVKFSVCEVLFYVAMLFLILIFPFVGCFANVSGRSMEQTLYEGDYLFVSKVSKINRGDIVIVKRDNYNKYLVKRVIGVSGDNIKFDNNNLYLNDELLNEDYINKAEEQVYTDYSETVADNCYYVLGDNRNHSGDSRSFGDVTRKEIIGVVKCNLTSIGITRKRLFILSIILLLILIFIHPYKRDKSK